jgi:two-component system response regulator FlrC
VFREDLYYRLNVFPVPIPALRNRRDDILAIAQHFLASHGASFRRIGVTLSTEAEVLLKAYDWPGNVRELENVIQRALILSVGSVIGPESFDLNKAGLVADVGALELAAKPVPNGSHAEAGKSAENMKDIEREHILRTLAEMGGSRKLTIERLGISERTLRYKLQQYRDEGYFDD